MKQIWKRTKSIYNNWNKIFNGWPWRNRRIQNVEHTTSSFFGFIKNQCKKKKSEVREGRNNPRLKIRDKITKCIVCSLTGSWFENVAIKSILESIGEILMHWVLARIKGLLLFFVGVIMILSYLGECLLKKRYMLKYLILKYHDVCYLF